MLKENIKNVMSFLVVIFFIAASVFFRPEFAYLLYIFTTIILICMLSCLAVCKAVTGTDPKMTLMKYKIFISYVKKKHLPESIDAVFYGIIILFSGFYGMMVTSTCWLIISLIDFRLRALSEKAKPIIFDDRFKNFINIIEGGKK